MITAIVILSGFGICAAWIYAVNWALSDKTHWWDEEFDNDDE